jgi:uncharacterized protein (DUF1684 family)
LSDGRLALTRPGADGFVALDFAVAFHNRAAFRELVGGDEPT